MGGGRANVPGQVLACAGDPAYPLPGDFARTAGGMRGEGRQVGHHRQFGRGPAPVSEIVPGSYPLVPGRLEVPFPILRRMRPQAAVSVTLQWVMPRSVTKPLR